MNNAFVSIIVPCYNQAQYLDESLQSVFNQTYANWECIIVNDGSPDHTEAIAKSWVEKDDRFIYLLQENTGICGARNFGIANSTGEFILSLDADDKIAMEYIRFCVNEFTKDKSLSLVYTKAAFFDDKNELWNLADFNFKNFLMHNCIYCSAIFKRDDFFRIGGYDVEMKYGLEDWEFWINLLSLYEIPKVKKIEYLGFFYRIKDKSRNAILFEDALKEAQMMSVICKKHYLLYERNFGNYITVIGNSDNNEKEFERKLKSEKFVIDVFCKNFFGFTIFNKLKNHKL